MKIDMRHIGELFKILALQFDRDRIFPRPKTIVPTYTSLNTMARYISKVWWPYKIITIKWKILQVIFWKYFQSGLTEKIVKKYCNSAAVDNFSK